MKTTSIAAIAVCALLAGCQQVPQPETTTDAAGNTLVEWPLPAGAGAAQPDMSLAPDGRLLLRWIKPFDRTRHELQYTSLEARTRVGKGKRGSVRVELGGPRLN